MNCKNCGNTTRNDMKYCIFHDDVVRRKLCPGWVYLVKPSIEHSNLKYDDFPKEDYQEWFDWVHDHKEHNQDDSYKTILDVFSYEKQLMLFPVINSELFITNIKMIDYIIIVSF